MSWEERMALRHRERSAHAENERIDKELAAAAQRKCVRCESVGCVYDYAACQGCLDNPFYGKWPVTGFRMYPEGLGHDGHFVHYHGSHPGFSVCSCGEMVGVFSFVLGTGEDPVPSCPLCEGSRL